MSRRARGVLAATLAAGLALSLASSALAAPIGMLKQFKVPTANSQPRGITNGSDGNVWFTEGTEFTNAPPKIARITPAGAVTEISDDCKSCNLARKASWYQRNREREIARVRLAGREPRSSPCDAQEAQRGAQGRHS